MPKFNTADRLKQLMLERDLRQVDIIKLAQPYAEKYKTKIGRNDISQYLSGKVMPRQTKIFVLAKALNVNEAWLMGYDVDRTPSEEDVEDFYNNYNLRSIKTKRIPMLGKIACGEPITANQEYETFVDASSDINADFCLTAKGDSMINARIFDGDIVFLIWQPDVNNGEIAAVRIGDEVTLKRVYKYNNRIELRAENPLYQPLSYEGHQLEEIEIIGKAVFFQSSIR